MQDGFTFKGNPSASWEMCDEICIRREYAGDKHFSFAARVIPEMYKRLIKIDTAGREKKCIGSGAFEAVSEKLGKITCGKSASSSNNVVLN